MPPRKRDETPVPCACPSARHKHGTDLMYLTHKCGCRPCKDAHTVMRRKMRATSYQDGRLVDAGPAAERIRYLNTRHGYTIAEIAELSGVGTTTLTKVRNGRQQSVSSITRDALFGVKPRTEPTGYVDATGTRRRLEALAAIGWSLEQIAEASGFHDTVLRRFRRGAQPRVHIESAERVKAVYDELSMRPAPADTRERRGAVKQVLSRAEREGWLPPMAWDDDQIDDPDYTPQVQDVRRSRDEWSDDRVEELRHLIGGGIPVETAVIRAGYPNLKAAYMSVSGKGLKILAAQLTELAA